MMRGPLIGRKDFQLPLDKENNLKEGSWKRTKGKRDILCFVEGKGGEGKYGKEINSYVGKGVVHEKKKYVQTRAWKEVVCSKYLKWSS
jgi:hypothetical protein